MEGSRRLPRSLVEELLARRDAHSHPGAWLRLVRRALGLTQREFGARLAYSEDMVRKLERGERRISLQALEGLARWLGCTPAEHAALRLWLRGHADPLPGQGPAQRPVRLPGR